MKKPAAKTGDIVPASCPACGHSLDVTLGSEATCPACVTSWHVYVTYRGPNTQAYRQGWAHDDAGLHDPDE